MLTFNADTPEKITVYRICVVKTALKLLSRGIKPNGAYTIKATLAVATVFTGKQYSASRKACVQAVADIEAKLNSILNPSDRITKS